MATARSGQQWVGQAPEQGYGQANAGRTAADTFDFDAIPYTPNANVMQNQHASRSFDNGSMYPPYGPTYGGLYHPHGHSQLWITIHSHSPISPLVFRRNEPQQAFSQTRLANAPGMGRMAARQVDFQAPGNQLQLRDQPHNTEWELHALTARYKQEHSAKVVRVEDPGGEGGEHAALYRMVNALQDMLADANGTIQALSETVDLLATGTVSERRQRLSCAPRLKSSACVPILSCPAREQQAGQAQRWLDMVQEAGLEHHRAARGCGQLNTKGTEVFETAEHCEFQLLMSQTSCAGPYLNVRELYAKHETEDQSGAGYIRIGFLAQSVQSRIQGLTPSIQSKDCMI
ncbi:hypothetical protein BKA62DRAFT_676146 [Auriculariales sp. MPI-PUGE-AT-0066]|nr:hypothetical protein BKA62DRAFT_676146 [Auriculariales sp. MPI-PUGE-AT-0066]